MTFLGADFSNVSFDTVMIIVSWICLLAMIYSSQWFDKVTDGYFIIVILLFLASRLARYNELSLVKPATYIAIGVGMGLVLQCILNSKGWPAVWLLGIFAIEICVIEFEETLSDMSVNMTSIFPSIDFIDSKFTLDPTTITDWDITPSLL